MATPFSPRRLTTYDSGETPRSSGSPSSAAGAGDAAGPAASLPCPHPRPARFVELEGDRLRKVCLSCGDPLEPPVARCPVTTAHGERCRLPRGHKDLRQWKRSHGDPEAAA